MLLLCYYYYYKDSDFFRLTVMRAGFDLRVTETVMHKRACMSSPTVPNSSPTDLGPLFNQFVVVGAPRAKHFPDHPQPTLLLVYPSSPLIFMPEEFGRLPSFCFPAGFGVTDVHRSKKELVLDQFVFAIKTSLNENRDIYGVCTQVSFASSRDAFFYSRASKVYPTCFCHLTSHMAFGAIWQYQILLAKWIGGQLPSVVPRPVVAPIEVRDEVVAIPGMTVAGEAQRIEGFIVPRVFLSEMAYIRGLEMDPLKDLVVTVSPGHSFVLPAQKMNIPSVCYLGLDLLFSKLSVQKIVHAVSLLLLERHVAVAAKCLHHLSLSILCLRELCGPLKLHATFVPILPENRDYLGILHSPVPYVCGIVRKESLSELPPYVAIIDIDRGTITDPEESPLLADSDSLIAKLKDFLSTHKTEVSLPRATGKGNVDLQFAEWVAFLKDKMHGYVVPWSYLRYDRSYVFGQIIAEFIVDIFRGHFPSRLAQWVRPCSITDTTDIGNPVTVFNRELFLESVPQGDRSFYEAFTVTTVFQAFVDSAMDENERTVSQSRISTVLPDETRVQFAEALDNPTVHTLEDDDGYEESEGEGNDAQLDDSSNIGS
jgi:hypothetical protein